MAENDAVFSFGADTSKIDSAMTGLEGKLGNLGATAAKAIGAFFAIDAGVRLFKAATEAAVESEKAVKQFNFALKAAGVFTEEASVGFQKYAESLQAITGVSDEAILEGATSLIQIGELSGETLNRTIVAALDLAAARGIEASQAFEMLSRAAQGNIMPFAKMGVEFQKNATDAEKLNTVLGFIEGRFSGAAQDQLKGFSGALKNLSVTWDDFLENLGKTVTEGGLAVTVINGLTESIKFLQFFINANIAGVKNWIATFQFLGQSLSAVSQGIGLLDFDRITRGVSNANAQLQATIAANDAWLASTVTVATNTEAFLIPSIKRHAEANQQVKMSIEEMRNAQAEYQQMLLSAAGPAAQFKAGFVKGMMEMSQSVTALGRNVAGTFTTGFSNAFASVGKALVKGEDAFGAFGGAILQMLGAIAIQMGQFYIAAGIAAMFLNPGSGIGMILAGGALSVLGGVLQALGGGGGSSPAPTPIGASQPLGQADSSSFLNDMTQDEERVMPQTGVQVIVQGNVFDSRETGLQIAQIINDSFDNNGVLIRANA